MHIDFLIDIFKKNLEKNSIVWKNNAFSYKWLLKEYEFWIDTIDNLKLKNAKVKYLRKNYNCNRLFGKVRNKSLTIFLWLLLSWKSPEK